MTNRTDEYSNSRCNTEREHKMSRDVVYSQLSDRTNNEVDVDDIKSDINDINSDRSKNNSPSKERPDNEKKNSIEINLNNKLNIIVNNKYFDGTIEEKDKKIEESKEDKLKMFKDNLEKLKKEEEEKSISKINSPKGSFIKNEFKKEVKKKYESLQQEKTSGKNVNDIIKNRYQ